MQRQYFYRSVDTIAVRVKAAGHITPVSNKFGEPNDVRFGRRITLIAGL